MCIVHNVAVNCIVVINYIGSNVRGQTRVNNLLGSLFIKEVTMEDKVMCPKCKTIMKPKVYKNDKMIFGIECVNCGYDMINEVMQAAQEGD